MLSAKAANGKGNAVDISGFKNVTVQVYTTGTTTATVKFAVSLSDTCPDFGAAQSATNVYDYIDLTPLNNQASPIVGGTGIAISAATLYKLYQVDTNFVKWICPVVSGYSAGAVTVEINGANDNDN
jgi:hypothetical protein